MFTEKNLPRLIIATPIVTVLLFALLIIYFFIASQYSNFEKESLELEEEYVATQKSILINENKKVYDYIQYHRKVNTARIHSEFRQRVKGGEVITNEFFNQYEKESESKLKKQIIAWMESVRYQTNGYVWVHDINHHLVAHPFRRDSIGIDDTENTDATGAKIFKKFINVATENPKGGFVDYYWSRTEIVEPGKKLGFLRLDKEWGWVIGTRLYVDDIEHSIFTKKLNLEKKMLLQN